MVYAPQRRHAISSFTLFLTTLIAVQYLYSPSFLILIARILVQSQIINSHVTHPGRSLFGLGSMLTFLNIMAAAMHSLDFMTGMSGGKGVILDFVGQSTPVSLTRVVALDAVIWIAQLVSLELTYITAHAGNIPHSTSFPYADYLLPPPRLRASVEGNETTTTEDDKGDDDIESGLKKRRRKGFESAFEELDGEMDALWLNDDNGGRPRASSSSRLLPDAPDERIREPPLVFSLSFFHMIALIIFLPLPNPPPAAFAGGTPLPSPPVTPSVGAAAPDFDPHRLRTATLLSTGSGADSQTWRIMAGRQVVSEREVGETANEDDPAPRMPGDYLNVGNTRNG